MAKQKAELAIGEQQGSIWRRSKDTYMVRMMVGGTRQYINAGSDYKAALLLAQDARKRRSQERMTGRNTLVGDLFKRKSQLTVGSLVERYIEARQPLLKPLTMRFYRGTSNNLYPLYDMGVDDLSLTEISSFVNGLQARHLSAKTINHALALARAACNFGIKEKWVETNPFKEVDNLRVTKHEPNPFTRDELTRIFANSDEHLLPYFLLQASTGMRTGELLALRWKDFDWKHNLIKISRSRWGKIEESTKTKGSEREVFIIGEIRDALKLTQKQRRAHSNDHVVINKSGSPYQIYLHRYWKAALKAAKVKYRPNYVLRSTFASMALQEGADIGFVSKALGHTSIRITTDKYARYLKDADKRNKDKVTQMFSGIPLKSAQGKQH